MAFSRTVAHATSSDGTFSAAGATAWNTTSAHNPEVAGATSGGIPYFDSTTTETCSALLAANALVIGGGAGAAPFTDGTNLLYTTTSGPVLQVGSGTTTLTGFKVGYDGSSGKAAIRRIDGTTVLQSTASFTYLNSPGVLWLTIADSTRAYLDSVAGSGLYVTAGTATTDVNALSVTQTWNAAGTGFKANRTVITNTASAAGSMHESWEFSQGQGTGIALLSELTTIAAAATTDTTIQMPAGAVVLGVSVRVTTVIPTATNFTVGDSGSAARFSTAAVSSAAGSTDKGTKAGAYYNAGALAVRITPDIQPADNSGRVRVTIHYYVITAPSS